MEVGGYGYIKPELVKIAEEIYAYRGKIKELEIELSEEEFHYGYISVRQNLVLHEVFFRLLFIIPITLLLPVTLSNTLWFFTGAFLAYCDIRLIIREVKMLYLLIISVNIPFVSEFVKKYDLNSFQNDRDKTSERIRWIQMQIEDLEHKISDLGKKRREILEENRKQEEQQKKERASEKGADKFKLKEAGVGIDDARRLYEYYLEEERYVNDRLIKLDGKMQHYDRELVEIEEEFQKVKKNIILFFIVFLIVIFVQSFFTNILYIITAILGSLGMIICIIYLERVCKAPVLKYLVEHDSKLTKEYAFLNNVIPVKNKRRELQEEIEYYRKELLDIKKKKAEIDIS